MKPKLTRTPSACILSPIFHNKSPKSTLLLNLQRSLSTSSSCCTSSPPSPLHPRTPLFLRPSTHSTTFSDLRKWHLWAKCLAAAVGSTFVASDNGPDSAQLHRELKWLLEDALERPSLYPQLSTAGNDEERPIRVRASLDELYVLWKQRIEERRPFQYVVGCEHWRDMVLCVQEGVLIPRPETELIVDLVGDVLGRNEGLRDGLWADLGTGSGAIAIGIGRILGPRGKVIATDLSPAAVAVSFFNVQRYGLQDIIDIRQGSWFEPLKDVEGKLAGLVSNPPYIPSDHIYGLQAEVGKHEPRLALDGGVNGMDDLLHLCRQAASMLKPGGFFAFETNGEKQCMFLVDYMTKESVGSFCNINMVPDFAGIKRFVTGFRI
ncbi:uncharacterized protein LOC131145031 [Malania oleifera]|uniref:uncharacterized protein LOC131145031 n=1 Tax=Malania oleifera TaxID=397392 RepID=UPI0025AEAA42|nr:uncharacterized protein LOC131145031 [Malania oleifera]